MTSSQQIAMTLHYNFLDWLLSLFQTNTSTLPVSLRICRGCLIACDSVKLSEYVSLRRMEGHGGARYLAIDWEPTALHLRYQTSREHDYTVHESVGESQRRLTDPMDLQACLDHFISPENLAEEDCYYCSKCKKHRRAKKKLDVWKAPPILVRIKTLLTEEIAINIFLICRMKEWHCLLTYRLRLAIFLYCHD